jgi:hypothetical protein
MHFAGIHLLSAGLKTILCYNHIFNIQKKLHFIQFFTFTLRYMYNSGWRINNLRYDKIQDLSHLYPDIPAF